MIPAAYYNRGNIYLNLYKYADALKDFSKAIEITPTFQEAYFNRGITYMNLSDTVNACFDFCKSGELGNKDAYFVIRNYCSKK